MKVVITGAGGFVGKQLALRLMEDPEVQLTMVDHQLPSTLQAAENVTLIGGDMSQDSVRRRALEAGVDIFYHLAAVPGGAAEADPALSRQVNLNATLDWLEEVSSVGDCPRVVFSSTIAVLGAPLPSPVTDACPIQPEMVYGTHKAMVELALADMTRRGKLDSVAVRLPGILARPLAPSGMKSAFMSNVFHAIKDGQSFVCPVSDDATLWVMSVAQCVENLVHAGRLDGSLMPASRTVTLPALYCSMGDIVQALCREFNQPDFLVTYQKEDALQALFGDYPPLHSCAAEKAGFSHDGSVVNLVRSAIETLNPAH